MGAYGREGRLIRRSRQTHDECAVWAARKLPGPQDRPASAERPQDGHAPHKGAIREGPIATAVDNLLAGSRGAGADFTVLDLPFRRAVGGSAPDQRRGSCASPVADRGGDEVSAEDSCGQKLPAGGVVDRSKRPEIARSARDWRV